MQLRAFGHELV